MRRSTLGAAAIGAALACGAGRRAAASDDVMDARTGNLVVPGDYSTIQAAVDAARRDVPVTIRVGPGTYHEAVFVSGFASLTLIGDPGALIAPTTAEPAVSICTSSHVEVSGFTLTSPDAGVYVLGAGVAGTATDVVAHDLDIKDCGTYGVQAVGRLGSGGPVVMTHYGHTETVYNASDVMLQIADSTIESAGIDAVNLGDQVTLHFSGSTIQSPARDGVHADGSTGAVNLTKTQIIDAGDDGVDSRGIDVNVNLSSIVRPAHDGVSVDGTAVGDPGHVGVRVRLTSIEAPGNAGIDVRRTRLVVDGGSIAGSLGDGVVVGAGATSEISGISVRLAAGDAIVTRDDGSCDAVTHCRVSSVGGDGVHVTGPSARVQDNTVSDAVGAGIVVSGDAVAPVRLPRGSLVPMRLPGVAGNHVDRTGGAGIVSTVDGLPVQQNVVTESGADGVSVDADGVLVANNTVTAARGDGLSVAGLGTKVHDNVVVSAVGNGIDLGASRRAVVLDNQVTGCQGCGVALGAGAKSNRLARNSARLNRVFDLYEADGRGSNTVARSNHFTTKHRRRHHAAT